MSAGPHLLDDVSVRLGDLALHPQRVGEVELVQVGAPQEVLGQGRRVAQTLREGEEESEVAGHTVTVMTSSSNFERHVPLHVSVNKSSNKVWFKISKYATEINVSASISQNKVKMNRNIQIRR